MIQEQQNFSDLEELIVILNSNEDLEGYIDWMIEICSSKKKNNLTETIMVKIGENIQTDIVYANQLFGVLRNLNEIIPQEIHPQLQNSQIFPELIATYLTKVDMKKNMTGDAFLLLASVFTQEKFSTVIDGHFVLSLFNSFEFIQDEEVFRDIIQILVEISNSFKNKEDNLVIKMCRDHPNTRFFSETFVHLLNKSELDEKLESALKFFDDIIETWPDFFYPNDFNILVDLTIRNIQDLEGEQRLLYLKGLRSISKFKSLQEVIGVEKFANIQDLMMLVLGDCDNEQINNIAQEIMELITS